MLRIYVCGPTVYDEPHIGNFRPIITLDIYARALLKLGHKVHLTHNVTDIDDKIIARAIAKKTTENAISTRFFQSYRKLLKEFNVTTISELPLVTTNIEPIIEFIARLVDKQHAYVTAGNVFFDTTKSLSYGRLSGQNLLNTSQINKNPLRKSRNDFLLWKKTGRGIKFASPWGLGRPGWHTECAALVASIYKGHPLDVHSGGIDLIFPHHENENAQFAAVFNKQITRVWKHTGQLSFQAAKMSKSARNIISAHEFIESYGADTLRMVFLASSPTKPLAITERLINNAFTNVKKLKDAYYGARLNGFEQAPLARAYQDIANWKFSSFRKLLFRQLKKFNAAQDARAGGEIISLAETAGFSFTNAMISSSDKKLYSGWQKARAKKQYQKADQIRARLLKKGLI